MRPVLQLSFILGAAGVSPNKIFSLVYSGNLTHDAY